MIHAASLFHDDVIDEADTRRGVPSLNKVFGNKLAILAGESWRLIAHGSLSYARFPLSRDMPGGVAAGSEGGQAARLGISKNPVSNEHLTPITASR